MYSCLGERCPRIREFTSRFDNPTDETVRDTVDQMVIACDQGESDTCEASGEPRQDVRDLVAKLIADGWEDAQAGGFHSWVKRQPQILDQPKGEE